MCLCASLMDTEFKSFGGRVKIRERGEMEDGRTAAAGGVRLGDEFIS